MESIEQIKAILEERVAGIKVQVIPNASSSGQSSILVDNDHAFEAAKLLRDHPALRLDYASNVTGIDWPEVVKQEKRRVKEVIEGIEREIEHTTEVRSGGWLEVVYHLYSMELKHGPVILRLRTKDRSAETQVPSLTPIWRGAEFQEREVFDLYGVVFEGHPDLRRILMWEGFQDYPMRKDYTAPDDFEWEPTPHDEVLTRASTHYGKGGEK